MSLEIFDVIFLVGCEIMTYFVSKNSISVIQER